MEESEDEENAEEHGPAKDYSSNIATGIASWWRFPVQHLFQHVHPDWLAISIVPALHGQEVADQMNFSGVNVLNR